MLSTPLFAVDLYCGVTALDYDFLCIQDTIFQPLYCTGNATKSICLDCSGGDIFCIQSPIVHYQCSSELCPITTTTTTTTTPSTTTTTTTTTTLTTTLTNPTVPTFVTVTLFNSTQGNYSTLATNTTVATTTTTTILQ